MKFLRRLLLLALFPVAILAQAAAPTATLTWSPPTTNTDGTAITGALTYNVYQGPSATALVKVATGVTATTDTITTGLSDGNTYFWTVTAVVAGVESAQATPVSKTFPPGTPSPVVTLTVK